MTTPSLNQLVESTWSRIVTRWLFPVVLSGLGMLVWRDVSHTLETVQLIQFQQIKDGKDIDNHTDAIRELRGDMRSIEERLRANGISDMHSVFRAL